MTIGAIIISAILSLAILIGAISFATDDFKYKESPMAGLIKIFGALLIIGAIWGVSIWFYGSTEPGKRAIKTQQSELNGGIKRRVTVYDVEGDVIAEYEGKFDVDYDTNRIIFDDENNNRHIIYYPTGNVIIDEIDK